MVARQAPLSMGFSRQEYWSGLLRPHPGDLPDPGIETSSLMSPLAGGFFTTNTIWEGPSAVNNLPKTADIFFLLNAHHNHINQQ